MDGRSSTETATSLATTRLLALDVDGTLTDGQIVYTGSKESQSFCVLDGQAIVWLREAGVEVTWITGRGCKATERRAAELGVKELHLRVKSKAEVLANVQGRLGIAVAETVAMGDDLPDLGLAARAALFACPATAQPQVRDRADIVTRAAAGAGAVRELIEAILTAKGLWQARIEHYGCPAE